MEGNMPIPPVQRAGWQAIYRRVVEWQRRTRIDSELSDQVYDHEHDSDLPISKAEAQLEVQKWWWQL